MSWVIVVFGLMALILLHELGHFFAAKKFNIKVTRFFVFFPPTVFSRKRGETEYGIGLIPLGGFCSIAGMTPDETERLSKEDKPRAYSEQAVWKRIVVILAGPAVNIILAVVLLFIAELMGGGEPQIKIDRIQAGSPAALAALPLESRIISVDGQPASADTISQVISQHKCPGIQTPGCRSDSPVELTVQDGDQQRVINVWPRYSAEYKEPQIGVLFGFVPTSTDAVTATGKSFSLVGRYAESTGKMLVTFFKPETRKQVSGIVGISSFANSTVEHRSLASVFLIFGLISLSLGLLNLLPFLPLDGGHIAWALAEKARGRPLSMVTMYRYSMVGIVLIAFLVLTGLRNDLSR